MFKIKAENKITTIYIIVGTLWILLSDKILYFIVDDIRLLNRLQNLKGFFFVIITAMIFYLLIRQAMERVRKSEIIIKDKYEEIEAYAEEVNALNEDIELAYQKENKLNNDLEKMINLVANITENKTLANESYLSYLFDIVTDLLPKIDYAFLFTSQEDKLKLVNSFNFEKKINKEITLEKNNLTIPKNKVVKSTKIENLIIEKTNNTELQNSFSNITNSLVLNISFRNNDIGLINLGLAKDKNFTKRDKKILSSLINLSTTFFNIKEYNKLEMNFQQEIIFSFIKMLEVYDQYTGGHSQKVADLSKQIARKLRLSKTEIEQTYWTGLVHDIGKIAVSREVLNKKGRLTDEEYEEIKMHPNSGYIILAQSEALADISDYVLYHHERWDGNGYPVSLQGDEIPLISQIICVADAWNAMTTNRPYRDSLSKERAIQELKENRGTQFSPKIVDAFLKIIA